MNLIEKGTTNETEAKKFPWFQVAIAAMISGLLGHIWVGLLANVGMIANYNLGSIGCALTLSPWPFILILASIPFSKTKILRLDLETFALIYTVGISSAFFMNGFYPWNHPGSLIASRIYSPEESLAYVPWFTAPETQVVEQLVNGQVPIPWVLWLPTIAFWWTFQVAFSLFMISIATILRKAWIDIERVPFPHTIVAYELIDKASSSEKSFLKRLGKPFTIGLLVGLVVQVPIFMTLTFPWFPDVYGWRVNTCGFGSTWLTPDSPLAGVAGFMTFNKWPPFASVFYLAPANVLLSFLLWFFIYLILTQIAYMQGYYTGLLEMAGCGRNWCRGDIPPTGEPFKWVAVSNLGGAIGLVLFYLILNRRYLMDTARAAMRRMNPDKLKEFEANEPISYRVAYALASVSAILVVLIFIAFSFNPLMAIFILFEEFIIYTAAVRVFSLIGFNANAVGGYSTGFVWLTWPSRPEPISSEWVLSIYFNRNWFSDGFQYGYPGALLASLSSYKMANLTGTSNKTAFKATVLVSVIAPLAALISWLWMCYNFGASKLPVGSSWFLGWGYVLDWYSGAEALKTWGGVPPIGLHIIVGILLVGALSVLHSRFIWFPLEPVGFLLATTGHTLLEGIWTTILVAWVAKTFTLKFGGSKAYESFGAPFAAGSIVGTIIAVILGGFLNIVRFFIPF